MILIYMKWLIYPLQLLKYVKREQDFFAGCLISTVKFSMF